MTKDILRIMIKSFAAAWLVAGGLVVNSAFAAVPEKLNSDERSFIEFAAQTDLVNVRLAQMAQLQASSSQVKRFALVLERDHAADWKRLAAVARANGAIAPATLDEVHMNFVRRLSKSKAKSFDIAFLKTVINEHENAFVPYKREADNGFNPRMKAYARRALPQLDMHLRHARRLAASLP